MAEMLLFERKIFVWIDETGNDKRDFMRKYGYSIRGQRAEKHNFLSRGRRINVILAVSTQGIIARYITDETINTGHFYDFVRGDLLPNLHSFDGNSSSMIIMDNFSVHHTESVISLLHESGIVVTFLPPYSPDMNPTEEAFSYIKSYLKLHEDIMEATGNTIQLIN